MAMILASQSPRRRELLGQMGFSFTVRPAKGEELPHPELTPAQLVEELARQKALEVSAEAEADDVVVAADTVVAIDGKVLGKPHDKVHAAQMLSALSGREHTVYTGVAVKRGETLLVEHEATQVRFRPLTQREIDLYIQTGEPMDKAGAYAIQGGCMPYIREIQGEYTTVVGFPAARFYQELLKMGVDLQKPEEEEYYEF